MNIFCTQQFTKIQSYKVLPKRYMLKTLNKASKKLMHVHKKL